MFGYFAGSIFGFAYVTSAHRRHHHFNPAAADRPARQHDRRRANHHPHHHRSHRFLCRLALSVQRRRAGNLSHDNMITGGLMIFMSGAFWAVYVIYSKTLIQTYGSVKIIAAVAGALQRCPPWLSYRRHLGNHHQPGQNAILSLCSISLSSARCSPSAHGTMRSACCSPTAVGASLYLIPVFAIAAGEPAARRNRYNHDSHRRRHYPAWRCHCPVWSNISQNPGAKQHLTL